MRAFHCVVVAVIASSSCSGSGAPQNLGTTEVATPFRVNGDTLILGRDSVAHWRFTRVR